MHPPQKAPRIGLLLSASRPRSSTAENRNDIWIRITFWPSVRFSKPNIRYTNCWWTRWNTDSWFSLVSGRLQAWPSTTPRSKTTPVDRQPCKFATPTLSRPTILSIEHPTARCANDGRVDCLAIIRRAIRRSRIPLSTRQQLSAPRIPPSDQRVH
jgi:hypothetical protein